jgi:hypothetical protein
MNAEKFFASIRSTMFNPLKQSQVDGINAVLEAWEQNAPNSDPRWIAYSLATTYHETAATMQPIAEYGKGKGRSYGVPTGPWHQTYYGRGNVQLTWLRNYRLANDKLHASGALKPEEDLVEKPDLVMRPDIAGAIMVRGMIEGWFTGRKLSDFFRGSRSDWVDARTIINGRDRAKLIAGYGLHFYHALQED